MPDLAQLREEYTGSALEREDLNDNPVAQFRAWFEQAVKAELPEPNAMSLATVDEQGRPWQRTVLLKAYDERGFVFYTNYGSRKARQMASNAQVSVLFPWFPLRRQVMIMGEAEKISAAESFKYFASRPFGSKLGAWVSQQSSVISSRQILEAKLQELKAKFGRGEVPLPDFWGGYRIRPAAFEFWQGAESRLHDRFFYSLEDDGAWRIERLAP